MPLPIAVQAGITAAPAIIGLFQKTKKTPQERAAEGSMAQAQDLINLSMNPNDPRFKTMLENESFGIRQGFLQQLRDTIEANRRQALMGRQQFFDPERRDESMFSAVNQAGQQAQIQARSNVLNNINNTIQKLQNQSTGYGNLAKFEADRRNQKRQTMLGGLSAAGKGINSYFKQ